MIVRPATSADARAIATIQVRAWQAAYQGIVPESFLRELSVAAREERWQTILMESPSVTYVAEESDRVVGWISVGESRDDDTVSSTGELWAIYVGPDSWGLGAGQALWRRGAEHLRAAGYADAIVWVLKANRRGIRFYEAAGFVRDGGREKLLEIGGAAIPEIRLRSPLAIPAPD
jgi:ribosomal protein S18 acetylase RimI-like enzyme